MRTWKNLSKSEHCQQKAVLALFFCRRDADGRLQRCSRQPCRICPSTGKTTPVSGKPHCQWESCRKKRGAEGRKQGKAEREKLPKNPKSPRLMRQREKKRKVSLSADQNPHFSWKKKRWSPHVGRWSILDLDNINRRFQKEVYQLVPGTV